MNPNNIDPRMFLDMNSKQLKEWVNNKSPDEILAAVRAIKTEIGRLQENILEEIDQEMQDEDPDLSEATAVINRIRAM
jgi:hypothetical protein